MTMSTTLSRPKKIMLLVACVIGLSLLAFVPTYILLPSNNFRDFYMDALHFPAVWLFYWTLLTFTGQEVRSAIIVSVAIVVVEIVQLYVGRESSFADILFGLLGLIAGYSTTLRPFAIGLWLMYFGTLFMLRNDLVNHIEDFGDFERISVRYAWQPIKGPEPLNSIAFIRRDDKQHLRATRQFDNVYWGASLPIRFKLDETAYTKLNVCAQSEKPDLMLIRLNHRRAGDYLHRINLELPVGPILQCHILDLTSD